MVVPAAAATASLPCDFTCLIKATRLSRALSCLSTEAVAFMSPADRKLEEEEEEEGEEEEDHAYLMGKGSSGFGFSVPSAGLFLPDRDPVLGGDSRV